MLRHYFFHHAAVWLIRAAGVWAIAAFIVTCYGDEPARNDLPEPFTAAEFKKHVVVLASDELAGRGVGTEGSARAAEYIVDHFQEYGLSPILAEDSWFQPVPLEQADRTSGTIVGRNILAILPGRGNLKESAVIVCAHYDHVGMKTRPGADGEDIIYNGADDNASGVSAMLLVACALSEQRDTLPEAYRTVIFVAFDAEESGLVGARRYTERPAWPLDRTAAVLNFDSMGRLRLGRFFASDAESSPLLAEAVRTAAEERGLAVETRLSGHGRSDHVLFVDRGIPAMHFFTGANIDYHRVSDHWDKLNFEGGAAIAWIACQTVRTAMMHPENITFHRPDPSFDISVLLSLARSFGIVPNAGAQEGRYPQILIVIPDSPAAKAGVLAGDKIVALNGMVFTRVEDGLTILPQLSFANGLRMTLLRDDQEVEAVIPAEAFERLHGPPATRLENGKYRVQFRFQGNGQTKAVYLAGEFNDWQPTAHRMAGPDDDGLFTTDLELEKGYYQYKFVVDGIQWQGDPENMIHIGPYGNSLLAVGER